MMTLTPHQKADLRTIQQRYDDAAAARRAEAAKAQWLTPHKPEPKWRRAWRKFTQWLDGGVE